MFGWFKKKPADKPHSPITPQRSVPGAGVYRDNSGQVMYNMLDPGMQQFLGLCIGAIKKAGVRAKGTGSFSVMLGEDQKAELQLDHYWKEFSESHNPSVFGRVAEAAKQALGGG